MQIQRRPSKQHQQIWLSEVKRTAQPINLQHPITVRSRRILSGPTMPPEIHPYCEICLLVQGAGMALVGPEACERHAGDLLLYGSGVPHWFRINYYPFEFIAIHFLPSVIFELAPASDAAKVVLRFTARAGLTDRTVRPPKELSGEFGRGFRLIHEEVEEKPFGWEARIRGLLLEMLLLLIRWEHRTGAGPRRRVEMDRDWTPIERSLTYLREHVDEPIYARELSAAAGISESRLKVLFRDLMGTSWSNYLLNFRLQLAAARLCEPGKNILEIAQSVGFENLSHFSTTFRSAMGVSPSRFRRRFLQSPARKSPS